MNTTQNNNEKFHEFIKMLKTTSNINEVLITELIVLWKEIRENESKRHS